RLPVQRNDARRAGSEDTALRRDRVLGAGPRVEPGRSVVQEDAGARHDDAAAEGRAQRRRQRDEVALAVDNRDVRGVAHVAWRAARCRRNWRRVRSVALWIARPDVRRRPGRVDAGEAVGGVGRAEQTGVGYVDECRVFKVAKSIEESPALGLGDQMERTRLAEPGPREV